jgi:hypothetical protein
MVIIPPRLSLSLNVRIFAAFQASRERSIPPRIGQCHRVGWQIGWQRVPVAHLLSAMLSGDVVARQIRRMKIILLGFTLFLCPPLYRPLAGRWFPGEYRGTNAAQHLLQAGKLRRKFWLSFLVAVCGVVGVLTVQLWRRGELALQGDEWTRIVAVLLALTTALGRGGWLIQSWTGRTLVERIDRGMYTVGQVGAAVLLLFLLTL